MTVLQKQFVGGRKVYVLTSSGCHVDGIDCVFFKQSPKQSSKKFPCMSCRDLIYLTEGDYAEYLAERLIGET